MSSEQLQKVPLSNAPGACLPFQTYIHVMNLKNVILRDNLLKKSKEAGSASLLDT